MEFRPDRYDNEDWVIMTWHEETSDIVYKPIETPQEKAEFAYWVALKLANKLLRD